MWLFFRCIFELQPSWFEAKSNSTFRTWNFLHLRGFRDPTALIWNFLLMNPTFRLKASVPKPYCYASPSQMAWHNWLKAVFGPLMAFKIKRRIIAYVAQHSFVIFSLNNNAWITVTLRSKLTFSVILLQEISKGDCAMIPFWNSSCTPIVAEYLIRGRSKMKSAF